MTTDKQRERLGSGKKYEPRDNIDLDVIDAMHLGYGVQYGRFKADHPFTKDANEARLARKKSKATTTKKRQRKVQNYFIECLCCGRQFLTSRSTQRYCCDECRKKMDNARATERRLKRKQEEMQHD